MGAGMKMAIIRGSGVVHAIAWGFGLEGLIKN
jgi:hypothetical protein